MNANANVPSFTTDYLDCETTIIRCNVASLKERASVGPCVRSSVTGRNEFREPGLGLLVKRLLSLPRITRVFLHGDLSVFYHSFHSLANLHI